MQFIRYIFLEGKGSLRSCAHTHQTRHKPPTAPQADAEPGAVVPAAVVAVAASAPEAPEAPDAGDSDADDCTSGKQCIRLRVEFDDYQFPKIARAKGDKSFLAK